jgi:hypothetical protein
VQAEGIQARLGLERGEVELAQGRRGRRLATLEGFSLHADTSIERVEWLLSELVTAMFDRTFHLWVQDYALEEEPDFLQALAVIAEVARPVQPRVADLVRWTVQRGLDARDECRPETLYSVVPEIWVGTWDAVAPFLDATVERWPKALDPFAAPKPPAWKRKAIAPAKKAPRFPKATVKAAEAATMMPAAFFALWEAGASDDALDTFFEKTETVQIADLLLKWLRVEGDPKPAALQEALYPPHPLEREVGGTVSLGRPNLILLPADRLEPMTPGLLRAFRGVRLQIDPKRSFEQNVQAALNEVSPNLMLLDARDLTPKAEATVVELLQLSKVVVVCGGGERVDSLERAATQQKIPVLRTQG